VFDASASSSSTAESLHAILLAAAESLSSSGILCMAAFPTAHDQSVVPDEVEQAGFESLVDYDSATSRFWLATKSRESRASWFGRNQAEAELLIRKRLSKGSLLSLHSFDAAGMMSQKFPSRNSEDMWCWYNVGFCGSGHGFDPFVPTTPTSSFQVKHSGVGERAGRGIFAKQSVPKGSTIGMDTCVLGMFVPPATYGLLTSMYFPNSTDEYNEAKRVSDLLWKPVHGYVYGYGWVDNTYVRTKRDALLRRHGVDTIGLIFCSCHPSIFQGEPSAGVDASILTYTNHGCDGTYNTGTQLKVTERTAVLGVGPAANGYVAQGAAAGEEYVYNPYRDRKFPDWGCDDTTRALRDIEAGEELLDNYIVFGGSESGVEWEEVLIEVKRMCSGGVGAITQYEESEGRSSSHA
jgi:hypothetical protein